VRKNYTRQAWECEHEANKTKELKFVIFTYNLPIFDCFEQFQFWCSPTQVVTWIIGGVFTMQQGGVQLVNIERPQFSIGYHSLCHKWVCHIIKCWETYIGKERRYCSWTQIFLPHILVTKCSNSNQCMGSIKVLHATNVFYVTVCLLKLLILLPLVWQSWSRIVWSKYFIQILPLQMPSKFQVL
jgi:hypothetical protein